MSVLKRIRWKMWIILIILGLVFQILFDPFSSILNFSGNIQARIALPTAREKWNAQNIANYSFEIKVTSSVCVPHVRVEVRDNKVAQVNYIEFTGEILGEVPLTEWATSNSDLSICNYANFTMPQLFDAIEQSLKFVFRISFDTKDGFISEVHFGSPGGWGLLSPKISDCCSSFEIQNFQILER